METELSFYKILMDLPPTLGLPKGFTDKYGKMLPKKAKLRNTSGTTWNVRMEKLQEEGEEDECYFFTRGWTKFSQEMDLKIFEVLVFTYAQDSTFDVTVYASTALEKEPPVNNPSCQVQLKSYQLHHKFHIPKPLACGLTGKTEVRLEYPGGQSAIVKLNSCKRRLDFGRGWAGFCNANALAPNNTYSFELLSAKNVIRVRPHRQ